MTVMSWRDLWPTLSVQARRDVTTALVRNVLVDADKTAEILPRFGPRVTVCFSRSNTIPVIDTAPG
jgi:hypothetical protein